MAENRTAESEAEENIALGIINKVEHRPGHHRHGSIYTWESQYKGNIDMGVTKGWGEHKAGGP